MSKNQATGLSPTEVLKKFWGYDSFRPLQEDIINSILDGRDTLGLLPTGGGKSITFQIPALILPGVTLVVTPLISLMKDQVDNLNARGIRSVYFYSGMSRSHYNLNIDRARLGVAKIAYTSPERLRSANFLNELRALNISLIVVDEAHCISQWGYDFRPSYLKIAEVRRQFPDAPILALTASATPKVVDDIMQRLEFKAPNALSRSFHRDNLSYLVRYTDNKDSMLLKVLKNTSGTAIVYVRSRRRTREIAAMLCSAGIKAEHYHAGLDPEEKDKKQNDWKENRTRVIVATNAFGMGIDKPDVRVVVHYDMPPSLEEYYQEAGRAGRDGLQCYAVMLVGRADKGLLTRRINEAFPPVETIKKVYEMAGNFLNVAVGDGYGHVYEFNFNLFCNLFGFKPTIAHSSLMLLTRAGYIDFVEETTTRSRLMIIVTKQELYNLPLDAATDAVFQCILRSYTGLFIDYVYINESLIAGRAQCTEQQVYDSLLYLSRLHVISYIPRKTTPYIAYTTSREEPRYIQMPREVYDNRRKNMEHRINSMQNFAYTDECRSIALLRYFGEKNLKPCGLCDNCRGDRSSVPRIDSKQLVDHILTLAALPGGRTVDFIAAATGEKPDVLIDTIRKLSDESRVCIDGTLVSIPI
ncbi:MAG: RecQ family ATP-dependent DNA helicase [Muribaculaceae bacterium]|nr:RecQ family ATP-dependent DNA helicase [Muribaculaceae bacterium]